MGDAAAENEVGRIMNDVDTDKNGTIDYSGMFQILFQEFVIATLNKKNLLSEDRLETAFKMFDQVSHRK
jgi:Ca2+-binding EF-hand superfamily protein